MGMVFVMVGRMDCWTRCGGGGQGSTIGMPSPASVRMGASRPKGNDKIFTLSR
jgi:hypothetical protein